MKVPYIQKLNKDGESNPEQPQTDKEEHMGIQKLPYVMEEQPGEKHWCACGKSENQPYCDGSHERLNTGMTPITVTIETAKKVAWCGCKESKNKPYCDGTHSRL